MKTAIIVFTKVPKSGDIKTRLTIEKGGILTPDEAREVYEACLLDVINDCIQANCGDVYICYNRTGVRANLTGLLKDNFDSQAFKDVFPDEGGTFDQCMQFAADYILKKGQPDRLADAVILVGGDLPSLQPYVLQDAVAKLTALSSSPAGKKAAVPVADPEAKMGAALVESSCQEGGFSIIGLTCTTPFDFDQVFYNKDGVTALDMVVSKAAARDIPLGVLEMVPDLDIMVDLASAIPMIKALQLAQKYDARIVAPQRALEKIVTEFGIEASAAPPER